MRDKDTSRRVRQKHSNVNQIIHQLTNLFRSLDTVLQKVTKYKNYYPLCITVLLN